MAVSPEVLLISAMLRTRDHVVPAARGITSEMFHDSKAEFEWIEGYIALHRRTPSTGLFREEFPDFPVKRVDDVEFFCEQVRDNHANVVLRRGLNVVMSKLKQGFTLEAIKELSRTSISAEASLLGHGGDGDIFRDYDDVAAEVLKRKRRAEKTGFAGIPTGFPTLDELTSGIQPGWFVVLTADSGVGKTRSLVRMGCAASFSGFTSQYDALEQGRPDIAMQVHAFASSEFGQNTIRSLSLAQGKGYKTADYHRFLRSLGDTVVGKMHIADSRRGNMTIATMAAQIERNKVDVLFLDYMTLAADTSDWQGIADVSGSLQKLAQRYGVPIVTAAQINRDGAGKKDQGLDKIAGSYKIGQDADLVINVQKFSRRSIMMRVVKFRHGPEGWIFYLKFDPNQGVMEEITYDEAIDLRDEDGGDEERQQAASFRPRKRGSFHEMAQSRVVKTVPRTNGAVVLKKRAPK